MHISTEYTATADRTRFTGIWPLKSTAHFNAFARGASGKAKKTLKSEGFFFRGISSTFQGNPSNSC